MGFAIQADATPFQLFDINERLIKVIVFLEDICSYFEREQFRIQDMYRCLCKVYWTVISKLLGRGLRISRYNSRCS
jgi:hypothetical protein